MHLAYNAIILQGEGDGAARSKHPPKRAKKAADKPNWRDFRRYVTFIVSFACLKCKQAPL